MKIRRAKAVLVLFILFLLGLVALADSGRGGRLFQLAGFIPLGDKVGHFVLFGVLSFLVNLLQRGASWQCWRFQLLRGSAWILPLVTLEECSQVFVRSRSFDLLDLTADVLGIWVGGRVAIAYLNFRRARTNRQPPVH